MRKAIIMLILALPFLASPLHSGEHREGCTTAIFTGQATSDGAPMIWKNRDTDFHSNKVLFVKAEPYSYLALANSQDVSGRWAYGGLNAAGFAIMNSVGYNLPENAKGDMEDLEGALMADALRTCNSVADFETFLQRNFGPSMGSLSNFGVMDAAGHVALYEVNNRSFKKYDAAESPEKYLVNTNFSRSGKEGAGAGYLRFQRATELLKAGGPKISYQYILNTMAKDVGHVLLRHPSFETISATEPYWIMSRDTIDRSITSAAVVVHGTPPGSRQPVTFWVILGDPLSSIALPFWVEAAATPAEVREGEDAPIYLEARRIEAIARPFTESDRRDYLDLSKINNREGTGFLPRLQKVQSEIIAETESFLKSPRTAGAYAAFQSRMAQKALQAMKLVQSPGH